MPRVSGWSLVTGGCHSIGQIRCEVPGVGHRDVTAGLLLWSRVSSLLTQISRYSQYPPSPVSSVHHLMAESNKTSAISHQHLQSGICKSQGSSTQLTECGGPSLDSFSPQVIGHLCSLYWYIFTHQSYLSTYYLSTHTRRCLKE